MKGNGRFGKTGVSLIENAAKKVEGVTTATSVPPVANHTPTLNISWDINKIKVTVMNFRKGCEGVILQLRW